MSYFEQLFSLLEATGKYKRKTEIFKIHGRSHENVNRHLEETGRSKRFVGSPAFRPVLEPNQPLIQWIPKDLSPGLKRPGRESDHSIQSNAKIKKAWRNTYSCPTCLKGVKRGMLYIYYQTLWRFRKNWKQVGSITSLVLLMDEVSPYNFRFRGSKIENSETWINAHHNLLFLQP